MTLKAKIDEYKKQSAGKATPEMVEVMTRRTAELQETVPSRSIPKVGDSLPNFTLQDSRGDSISSEQLLTSGPLVVSFFRGMW